MNSRPMKHIDREDLYTNLEARVQYLHSFLDFSSRMSYPKYLEVSVSLNRDIISQLN
jgi:hypothetical protein